MVSFRIHTGGLTARLEISLIYTKFDFETSSSLKILMTKLYRSDIFANKRWICSLSAIILVWKSHSLLSSEAKLLFRSRAGKKCNNNNYKFSATRFGCFHAQYTPNNPF